MEVAQANVDQAQALYIGMLAQQLDLACTQGAIAIVVKGQGPLWLLAHNLKTF